MDKKKLTPPTHLEPMYLFSKYEPLRKSIYNKFKDKMKNAYDKEDLCSTIDQIFLQLVNEYDPNRGVDFPYYIKRMLDLRTYHHVSKYLKNVNKESYEEDEITVPDESFDEIIERIISLHSIDPDLQLGEKHRRLMVGVLIERKTLKELADEEGVSPDRVHARLYFLLRKLRGVYESHVKEHGKDLY
jgi:RNA polymerase sigma factor (sigma-70 family)